MMTMIMMMMAMMKSTTMVMMRMMMMTTVIKETMLEIMTMMIKADYDELSWSTLELTRAPLKPNLTEGYN